MNSTGDEDFFVNASFIASPSSELNPYYAVCEVLVAIFAVVGNAMVIFVFRKERRLRRRTNYYIVSLAAADLLVGLLGIPFAIMASVGLPPNLYACLFTVSLLVVLCTISIFCLVAVSVDRYWAILHPMGYSRNVRTRTALVIIGVCWVAGFVIGFLPLMGWYNAESDEANKVCYFLKVMDMNYLVFLYFGTIITPALVLAAFYAHIYRVVLKQLRQIVTISPTRGGRSARTPGGGTMLRTLGAAQKREVKATQNLSIIVLFFMICWIPLYTINCVIAFCRRCEINETFMFMCIILSHANSAGNPILYAYHLKDFREALKNFIWGILGKSHPSLPTTNRTSVMSHANHCVGGYKHFSLRESRLAHYRAAEGDKRYVESPIYYRKAAKSISLPASPKLVANMVAPENHKIWRISEAVGAENSNSHKEDPDSLDEQKSCSNSVKNGFYNDINYEIDDDVFLDDTIPITDINICPSILKSTTHQNEIGRIKTEGEHLSNSSPQLTQGVFLVEKELKTISAYNVKDEQRTKQKLKLSLSSDISSQATNGTKLSPLKIVSELLWGANRQSKSVSSDCCSEQKKNGLVERNDCKHSLEK